MCTEKKMNKSEVQEKNFKSKETTSGWVCPKCGKVLSPFEKTCSCSKLKQENVKSAGSWLHD